MNCLLCERTEAARQGNYPFLIKEFQNSFLFLGDHQYYSGYCVLVTKGHYREMTDLPSEIRHQLLDELMLAHQAIQNVFAPKKMNLCSLGNVVDHVHWHLFPRQESEATFKNPPFLQMHLFDGAKLTSEEAREVIERLASEVENLLSSVK